MIKTYFFIPLFILLCCTVRAQILIGASTQMATGDNTLIIVGAAGNLINNSTVDFSKTNLNIGFRGTEIIGDWSVKRFRFNSAGRATLRGTLTVTEGMEFISGIFQPLSGKLLFAGDGKNLLPHATGESYVDGMFHQAGNGNRQFPIGTTTAYAPVRLVNVQTTNEIGVQAFDGNPQLIPETESGIVEISPLRYWQINTTDPSAINSLINVSLNGVPPYADGSPVVVEGNQRSGLALNLGLSSRNDTNITSAQVLTGTIIGIGKQNEVVVRIHDLITPFTPDQINDGLYIENIDQFEFKKITLLDRWGVVVAQWGDEFSNAMAYDFSTLSPGNYICIAEFGSDEGTAQKISQMITVLKTK